MRAAKVEDVDYIQFLIAAQRVYSACEASRCRVEPIAHDAYTRLLSRQPPDTAALWEEVEPLVQKEGGCLVLDDTTLDKPHARHMELVTRHWSGKHKRVVMGINLLTLLWTDGNAAIPCDCRLYDKPHEVEAAKEWKGKTKNEYFLEMLHMAKERGFHPKMVCFDSWYASIENLKAVRAHGWHFLTRLKSNRLVNPDNEGNVAVSTLSPPAAGQVVHLKEFGFVRLFRTAAPNGDAEYWITSQTEMTEAARVEWERQSFQIENYHRGLKQCCGVERCQHRSAGKQRNHILFALRAFVRLETHRLAFAVSWYEAKTDIVREAVRTYLERPTIQLRSFA